MKINFDRNHRVKDAPPLTPGMTVTTRDEHREGTVVQNGPVGTRSYLINSGEQTLRRNRSVLAHVLESQEEASTPTHDTSTTTQQRSTSQQRAKSSPHTPPADAPTVSRPSRFKKAPKRLIEGM